MTTPTVKTVGDTIKSSLKDFAVLGAGILAASAVKSKYDQVKQEKTDKKARSELDASMLFGATMAIAELTAPAAPPPRRPNFSALGEEERLEAESAQDRVEHDQKLEDHRRTAAILTSAATAFLPDEDGVLQRMLAKANGTFSLFQNVGKRSKRGEAAGECTECKQTKEIQENGICDDCNNDLMRQKFVEKWQQSQLQQAVSPLVHTIPPLDVEDEAPEVPAIQRFRLLPAGSRRWAEPNFFYYGEGLQAPAFGIDCAGSIRQYPREVSQLCKVCGVPGCAGIGLEKSSWRYKFNRACGIARSWLYDRRAAGNADKFTELVAGARKTWKRPDRVFIIVRARRIKNQLRLLFIRICRSDRKKVGFAAAAIGAVALGAVIWSRGRPQDVAAARASVAYYTRKAAHAAGKHNVTRHPECPACKGVEQAIAHASAFYQPVIDKSRAIEQAVEHARAVYQPFIEQTQTTQQVEATKESQPNFTTGLRVGEPAEIGGRLVSGSVVPEAERKRETNGESKQGAQQAESVVAGAALAISAAQVAATAVGAVRTAAATVAAQEIPPAVKELTLQMQALTLNHAKILEQNATLLSAVEQLQQRLLQSEKDRSEARKRTEKKNWREQAESLPVDVRDLPEAEGHGARKDTKGKGKFGRGGQKAATKRAGKMLRGSAVWYDGDPAEQGERILLMVGEEFKMVAYEGAEMRRMLKEAYDAGMDARYFTIDHDAMDFDSEQGHTATVKTRKGTKTFKTDTAAGRRDYMNWVASHSGNTEHLLSSRQKDGTIRYAVPYRLTVGAHGPIPQAPTAAQKLDLAERLAKDEEKLRRNVLGTTWAEQPLDEDEAESAQVQRGFAPNGDYLFCCRHCKQQGRVLKRTVFNIQSKFGDDAPLPSVCLNCKRRQSERENGAVKAAKFNPEPLKQEQVPKRDESEITHSTQEEEEAKRKAEAKEFKLPDFMFKRFAVQGEPAATIAQPAPQVLKAAVEAARKEEQEAKEKKAESINAANPVVSVDGFTKTCKVISEYKRKSGAITPEISSGFAVGDVVLATCHGTEYSEEPTLLAFGHKFAMRKTCCNPNSEYACQGVLIPGYDLMMFPKPEGLKSFAMAKPVEGEPIFTWPCHESEHKIGQGRILQLGVTTSYKDVNDKIWTIPGLMATTATSINGHSGKAITNAKGEVVGIHVTSDGTPNSPSYAIPMTDELMAIIKKGLPPLNSKAGSGTTHAVSKMLSKHLEAVSMNKH